MSVKEALVASLLLSVFAAGCCRPVVIPDDEARQVAEETMSSTARAQASIRTGTGFT